ncbi:MAG: hypothetical protein FRX49_04966 [Trebouxia sp. A1-2]|nr:MAG: hypothetical protein FRX49_04966 [Trebouxia sp. A1-2]
MPAAQASTHQQPFGQGTGSHRGRPAGAVFQPCLQFIRQGNIAWALDTLKQLISECGSPERGDGDQILLDIAAPGGKGRVASALACLQVLPCEKGHYYYQLIKHYCEKRNLNALNRTQLALTEDDRWKSCQQVPLAPWFGLVRSYGLLSEPDLACSAFDEMQRLQIWQPTHVKTANALLNAVHADASTTYARFAKLQEAGLRPDRVTYNTLLKCCMRNRLADQAMRTYREMVQLAIPADEHTYTTLIKTLSYAGKVDDALQVQQMMVAADFDPTDTVWGSLMVACGQAGQLETALTLWQAFKRARGGLRNMKNAEPWCAMLIACAQTYHLQPALTVLSDMRQAGVAMDTQVYNCAMAACSVPPSQTLPEENLNVAFGLLRDMASQGVEADATTYTTLFNLCAEARQGHQAHKLMQELETKKVKLTTAAYTAFIKACGTSPGLVDAAHAAFKRMIWGPRRMKPNQVTFVTTMRVLREASRPHEALDVYLGMRRAGFPGVNSEFQEMVKACAEAALETDDSELKTKVGSFLLQHEQEVQRESVDLHSLSAKEARAAVLCILCNIQERFKHGEAVSRDLVIIVGRGQHVQQGGPKLREAIEQLLRDQLHMDLDQQSGTVHLQNDLPLTKKHVSKGLEGCPAEPAMASAIVADDSCGDVNSSSDNPAEVIAQVVNAVKGSKTQQQRQSQKKFQQLQQLKHPFSEVATQKCQHINQGRIVVSRNTLLQWLQSKDA